jgi:hypothetical protein
MANTAVLCKEKLEYINYCEENNKKFCNCKLHHNHEKLRIKMMIEGMKPYCSFCKLNGLEDHDHPTIVRTHKYGTFWYYDNTGEWHLAKVICPILLNEVNVTKNNRPFGCMYCINTHPHEFNNRPHTKKECMYAQNNSANDIIVNATIVCSECQKEY